MSTFNQVQQAIQQAQPVAFKGGSGQPAKDRDAWSVPIVCDFSATGIPATGYVFNPNPFFNKKQFSSLQSIFIDNTANNGFVLVFNPTFNQLFALPPGYQGYFPFLCPELNVTPFQITSTGTQTANINFISVAMPAAQWAGTISPAGGGSGTVPVSDAILDATVFSGRVQVLTKQSQLTGTDKSGTLGLANTPVLILPANASRQKWRIQNIDYTNLGAIWWSYGAGLSPGSPGTFGLSAASSAQFLGGYAEGTESNAIYLVSPIANIKYSATEIA